MSLPKILHVISNMDPASGGAAEGLRQLVKATHALGASQTVVSLDPPDAAYLQLEGAQAVGLGPGAGTFGYAPRFVPWLRRHAGEFDVVIINGLWQFHLPATWWALRGTGVPYLVYPHGMLDPWFKQRYPLKHAKKLLFWWLIQYRVLAQAAGVLFTCEEERLLAPLSFQPYRVKEFVVNYGTSLPTDIDPQAAERFLAAHPELAGKRLLLFLGRLHEKKGCDLLLEAFSKIANRDADLRLVMAGPDQTGWQATLQQMAKTLGIDDRVVWPGMLQGPMKWGAFLAAELFMLPSHQENFGVAVAEALALGTPVMISNKVNIWREVAAEQAGIVTDDSASSVAAGLESWLLLSPAERAGLGARAKGCFERRFDIRAAAARMLEVVRHVSRNPA